MAGDWIKFEHATPDKPEVFRMAEILQIEPDAVVGKLVRLWTWCDQQTLDGNSLGVSEAIIDRLTHQPGFSAALREVSWLQARSGSLAIPNFSRHNGQTAKVRALDNRKKAKNREKPVLSQDFPDLIGTKGGTREEKRREENKTLGQSAAVAAPASDFDWLYSLKANPAYVGINIDAEHGKMIAWCEVHRKQPTWRRLVNWLNRCERPLAAIGSSRPQRPPVREPDGWKAYLNHAYPESVYSAGGKSEAHEWSDLPPDIQAKIARETREGKGLDEHNA